MIYLCVDGGQTKTAASLLDAEGNTIESWEEGPLTTPTKPGPKTISAKWSEVQLENATVGFRI